jgi:hypothetical protein
MKPQRLTITHIRTATGQDLFTVSNNKFGTRAAAASATRLGHTVVQQVGRFDFTLQQWGLALDAVLQPNAAAARALANPTPRAPKAPRQGANPGQKRRGARGGPAFTTPKPSLHGLKLVALSAIEDVFVTKLRDHGVTDEARKAHATYKKLLAVAVGTSHATSAALTAAQQAEADTALRLAIIALVKQAF